VRSKGANVEGILIRRPVCLFVALCFVCVRFSGRLFVFLVGLGSATVGAKGKKDPVARLNLESPTDGSVAPPPIAPPQAIDGGVSPAEGSPAAGADLAVGDLAAVEGLHRPCVVPHQRPRHNGGVKGGRRSRVWPRRLPCAPSIPPDSVDGFILRFDIQRDNTEQKVQGSWLCPAMKRRLELQGGGHQWVFRRRRMSWKKAGGVGGERWGVPAGLGLDGGGEGAELGGRHRPRLRLSGGVGG